jgi:hypothetical protein
VKPNVTMTVDILGTQVEIPDEVGARAHAWATVFLAFDPTPEGLPCLIQALITEENRRVLLKVERAIVESI